MDRREYHHYMRATSDQVRPIILSMLESVAKENTDIFDAITFLTTTRLQRPLQKPTLLRLSFELCGGEDWAPVIPAAAAFELLNISSYHANAAFDCKLGVITRAQKDAQFIASMITRELAHRAVEDLRPAFTDVDIAQVSSAISVSNQHIYLAQHSDMNLLTVANLGRFPSRESYIDAYRARCHTGSGVFNGFCAAIGCMLAGGSDSQIQELRTFGENFGTALQIVNDIGDFVPPTESDRIGRTFQDQFSDLRNQRLTLPLYYVLSMAGQTTIKRIRAILEEERFDDDSMAEVAVLLSDEGAFAYAKRFARTYTASARRILRHFPSSKSKSLLLILISCCENNKYFVGLRKLEGGLCGTLRA